MRKMIATTAIALAAPALAVADHSPAPVAKDRAARDARFLKLWDACKVSSSCHAGRNVVEHGREKDGRYTHNRVRRGIRVLWNRLHPSIEREHRAAAQAEARARASSAPAWFVSLFAPVRACESGHHGYGANTGNGFYGAYQFNLQTWYGVGGTGNPAAASPREQDYRAYLLYQRRGTQPWPHCGRLA